MEFDVFDPQLYRRCTVESILFNSERHLEFITFRQPAVMFTQIKPYGLKYVIILSLTSEESDVFVFEA